MQINWFTVIAQAINFLLLVWLLKRYLYKPVLDAIDEREKKITAQVQDADTQKASAKKEQDEFRGKNEDFDQQKKGMMDKVVAETTAQRDKLLEGIGNDVKALQLRLEKGSRDAQENQDRQLAQKTREQVMAIANKALADIASSGLEEQSVNKFVRRLNELKEEEKYQFVAAFKSNSNNILARSAFELSATQEAAINNAVNDLLGTKIQLQFKTAPELISGIELTTNGYKLSWSIAAYISSLEKNIASSPLEKSAAVLAK